MKVIAFYLPQFHEVEENNNWYGKGFTEWNAVKSAKPLFKEHIQPKLPLYNNFYNLLDVNTIRWQAELARTYGIYGFCIYHYWIEGRLLLEKPMQLLLQNQDININYCISWANHNWTKSLREKSKEIVLHQSYGGVKDWEEHFNYLLPFFKDSRYIKIDGKPLVVIYRPNDISNFDEMVKKWNKMANDNGLLGISFAYQHSDYDHRKEKNGDLFDFGIEYEPTYCENETKSVLLRRKYQSLKNMICIKSKIPIMKWNAIKMDYNKTWNAIIKMKPRDGKMIPGAFIDWDNTPRGNKKGKIYYNFSVKKFQYYFRMLIEKTRKVYKRDLIFIFAWNEWGEGGYLEPDNVDGYGRLEAIRDSLIECNEWPF